MENKNLIIKILLAFAVFSAVLIGVMSCAKSPETTQKDNQLIIWGLFDEKAIYQPMIQQYKSQHPELEIKYYKISESVEEYETLLLSELAEGKGPDIFMFPNTATSRYLGKLTPLPDSLNITPLGFSDTFVPVVGQQMIIEDKIYGMPMYVDNLALYYNKEIFQNYIPSRGTPASTWEEISTDTPRITKSNRQNIITQSAISLGRADNISRAVDILYLMFLQGNIKMYDLSGTRANFATPEASSIFTFYLSFGDGAYKNFTWDEQITSSTPEKEIYPFTTGKLGSVIGYSYLYSDILMQLNSLEKKGMEHISKDDIAVMPIPNPDTETSITLANYFPFGVSKNSDKPEAAWKFLSFLTTPENLSSYHEKTHLPSPIRSLLDTQSQEEIYGIFASQSMSATSYDLHDEKYIYEIFYDIIDQASKGKISPENALLDAQTTITKHLETSRKIKNIK